MASPSAIALPPLTAVPTQARTPHPLLDAGGAVTLLVLVVAFLAPALAWVEWGSPLRHSGGHSIELHMLVWSALVSLLLPIMQINLAIRRHGGSAVRGNRDSHPRAAGVLGRASRAHANAIESLAPFAAIVLAAQAMGVSNRWTVASSVLYLVARALHAATYTLGITILRSSAFYAGWCATVTIAVMSLWLAS